MISDCIESKAHQHRDQERLAGGVLGKGCEHLHLGERGGRLAARHIMSRGQRNQPSSTSHRVDLREEQGE